MLNICLKEKHVARDSMMLQYQCYLWKRNLKDWQKHSKPRGYTAKQHFYAPIKRLKVFLKASLYWKINYLLYELLSLLSNLSFLKLNLKVIKGPSNSFQIKFPVVINRHRSICCTIVLQCKYWAPALGISIKKSATYIHLDIFDTKYLDD